MPASRAFPPAPRSWRQTSSPYPETAFPVARKTADPRESVQTCPDTLTPAPPIPRLPPAPLPDASLSSTAAPPFPPIPQSPPASSFPFRLLAFAFGWRSGLPLRQEPLGGAAVYRCDKSISEMRLQPLRSHFPRAETSLASQQDSKPPHHALYCRRPPTKHL